MLMFRFLTFLVESGSGKKVQVRIRIQIRITGCYLLRYLFYQVFIQHFYLYLINPILLCRA